MGNCCDTQQKASKQSSMLQGTSGIIRDLKGGKFHEKYQILQVIGHGSFGKIILAEPRDNVLMKVAIKAIPVDVLSNSYSFMLEEIKILRSVDHPNIIKYLDHFESEKYLYLVMEYCAGGELFEKIVQNKRFLESDARTVMNKLLRAINHCHHNGIIHRDIKPENIMYASKEHKAEVKLIDFGLSKLSKGNMWDNAIVGTPFYVSPEILDGIYGTESDIWALGVVMYILLSGCMPFGGVSTHDIFLKIRRFTGFTFDGILWKSISSEAKDLLNKLCNVNPKRRLKASEALAHPWFEKEHFEEMTQEQIDIQTQIIDSLREYRGANKLRKAAMNVFIKHIEEEDIENLRLAFWKMDHDKTGLITCTALQQVMRNMKFEMEADEIDKIIQDINFEGQTLINYSEFLAATISTQQFLSEERLWALFKHFDPNEDNLLSVDAVKRKLAAQGKRMNTQEIKDIMKSQDINEKYEGRQMSFGGFKRVMEPHKDNENSTRPPLSPIKEQKEKIDPQLIQVDINQNINYN
jgi:calcium-dependent protein kinase